MSYEDYAVVGYYSSFSTLFLPILNLSLTSYFLRNYFLIPDEKRQRVLNTIIFSLLGIGVFISIFVLGGLFLYFKLSHVKFPFFPFAYLMIFQIVFNNFLVLLQVNFRIKREAKKYARLTIFSSMLWACIILLLVVVFKYGAIGSLGTSFLVALFLGIYSMKKMLTKAEFDIEIFKDAVQFSWPLALSALLWFFLSGVDRVLLEKLNDLKSFGRYNIAISISGFFAIFYTAISQTFEPDIYKAISEKKFSRIKTIVLGIVAINAIPVFLFMLVATPATNILTGGRYSDAADFARILSMKNITISLYYSVITIIVGMGYTKSELGLRAIGAVLCVIMYNYLINHFGFYGAAWGQIISFLFMATIGTIFILFKLNKHDSLVRDK